MEHYLFVSNWFFTTRIERVWKELADVGSYPEWWAGFKQTTVHSQDRKTRSGVSIDYEVKGSLPYILRFSAVIVAFEPPAFLQFRVQGDLQGDLRYVLDPQACGTTVAFYWDNSTPKAIMNFSAKLPFVKSLFERNHAELMGSGYRGLKSKLEPAFA